MESNYENLTCLATEIKAAIIQSTKIQTIAQMCCVAHWTEEEAKKFVDHLEEVTK